MGDGLAEKKSFPKIGDKVPIEMFHVSKMNMRYGVPFGESEEDISLAENLRRGRKIVQEIIARPEDENGHWKPGMDFSLMRGYGVTVGKRRFEGSIEAGFTHLVLGRDWKLEEMTDGEAREASWIENFDPLRKNVDEVLRAQKLNEFLRESPLTEDRTLRKLAARWGVAASTLSEWRKPADLTPKLQKSLSDKKIFFTDAVKVHRLKLGEEKQDELAELAETEGIEAFKGEVARLSGGGLQRGIPAGKYEFAKVPFDKRYPPDMETLKKLDKQAEDWHMDRNKAAKRIIEERLKKA